MSSPRVGTKYGAQPGHGDTGVAKNPVTTYHFFSVRGGPGGERQRERRIREQGRRDPNAAGRAAAARHGETPSRRVQAERAGASAQAHDPPGAAQGRSRGRKARENR